MKLSILISQRNDPFGTLITIRAIMEELKVCNFNAEIIVVDNSDNKEKIKTFYDIAEGFIKREEIKLIYLPKPCLFSARDLGVSAAKGEYILVLDSHCLLYYNSLKNMIAKADSLPNLGVLFGAMCYSETHELDAFVDREVDTFYPIRLFAYLESPDCLKVPLRGMPYLIKRELFNEMRGYEPLSTHKLVWGGGDFLISFKPLILGYDNYVYTKVGAIHLGPFRDGGFFTKSFNQGDPKAPHRYIGMLTSAFVIGGEKLLDMRCKALSKYNPTYNFTRTKSLAYEYGSEFRRWLTSRAKRTYDEIYNQFKNTQGDTETRKFTARCNLPQSGAFSKKDIYVTRMFAPQLPSQWPPEQPTPKKINWHDFDKSDCLKFKQTEVNQ